MRWMYDVLCILVHLSWVDVDVREHPMFQMLSGVDIS